MENTLTYGDYIYHIDANKLTTGSNIVHLTPDEQRLTTYLFEHQNTVITHIFLMDLIDADEIYLRKKLAKLKGIGFKIEKDNEKNTYCLRSE